MPTTLIPCACCDSAPTCNALCPIPETILNGYYYWCPKDVYVGSGPNCQLQSRTYEERSSPRWTIYEKLCNEVYPDEYGFRTWEIYQHVNVTPAWGGYWAKVISRCKAWVPGCDCDFWWPVNRSTYPVPGTLGIPGPGYEEWQLAPPFGYGSYVIKSVGDIKTVCPIQYDRGVVCQQGNFVIQYKVGMP